MVEQHTQEVYTKLMIGLIASMKEENINMKIFDADRLVYGSRKKKIMSMTAGEKEKLSEEIFIRLTHMTAFYGKEVFTKLEILDYLAANWM